MCCSREHYPVSVGLHQYEEAPHHHHIILPWNLDIAVCVNGFSKEVSVAWRYFSVLKVDQQDLGHGTISYQGLEESEGDRLSDLISVGIAEGGVVSIDWLNGLAEKFFGSQDKFILGGNSSWDVHPPEALEYHEWLVLQANAELKERKIITGYEQMQRDHAMLKP